MLSLELHSAHHDQPEEVGLFIVSAGDDLMINKGVVNLPFISMFSLVISNQDKS